MTASTRSDERSMRKAARQRQQERRIPYAEALRQVREEHYWKGVWDSIPHTTPGGPADPSTYVSSIRVTRDSAGSPRFEEAPRSVQAQESARILIYGKHKSGATTYATQAALRLLPADCDPDQVLLAVDEPRVWAHLTGTYVDPRTPVLDRVNDRTRLVVVDTALSGVSARGLDLSLPQGVAVVYVTTNRVGDAGRDSAFVGTLIGRGWEVVNVTADRESE